MSTTQTCKRADHRGGHVLARRRGRPRQARASSRSRWPEGRSATCTATTPRTSSSPRRCGRSFGGEGRIAPHPVFPDTQGPASRADRGRGRTSADVIALMRLNYDRIAARPLPAAGSAVSAVADRGMSVAIVTGASRGLGLALARSLSERGWRLVVDARDGRRRSTQRRGRARPA